jgi:general secretion pathway protein L
MLAELKDLFATWIAAVAAAIYAIAARVGRRRRVLLQDAESGSFTARLAAPAKDATLQPLSFRLLQGRAQPPLPEQWLAAFRGSHIEVNMKPDQVLFRDLDFPKQAAGFLDGMVRAQIDRLTPWPAGAAVYGLTPPQPSANDRIGLTLAATSQQKIQPLIDFAADLRAASVAGYVSVPGAAATTEPLRLFDIRLTHSGSAVIDLPRLLRRLLLGGGLATAATFAVSVYFGGTLDAEQQDLQHRIAQRRAALSLNQGTSSAETLLAKRKQTSPSSVMVLEALARRLPDTTYVTELRVEGDKVQVVGLSQDAPTLIRLLEQSPQFTRATFFAPTTRAPEESGERFHIEAHITPYFGSGS